jgi:O-antigen/teichoic acid export membrane protein
MLSFPAYCLMYIYSTLLTSNGSIKNLIVIALLGSFLSLSINYFFIHQFHAVGVALTACLVMWLLAMLYIILSIKKKIVNFKFMWVFKYIVYVTLCALFNGLLNQLNVSFVWAIPMNAILFLVLVYAFRFWDKKYILALGQSNVK